MPSYRAPVEDVSFLLKDVFGIEKYGNLPGFSDLSGDMLEAILSEGAKLCEEVLAPINGTGDREGCTRHAGGQGWLHLGQPVGGDKFHLNAKGAAGGHLVLGRGKGLRGLVKVEAPSPLEDARAAQEQLCNRASAGKVLLKINPALELPRHLRGSLQSDNLI